MSTVEDVKNQLNAAIDKIEDTIAAVQLGVERSREAGTALYEILMGSSNQDVVDAGQIIQAVNEGLEERVGQLTIAKERIQQYIHTL